MYNLVTGMTAAIAAGMFSGESGLVLFLLLSRYTHITSSEQSKGNFHTPDFICFCFSLHLKPYLMVLGICSLLLIHH